MYIHYVEDELSVEDDATFWRSSPSCSRRFADDTCAASTAAAAFHTFRQLAAEVSALDGASCSIIEKLVKVAARRRKAEDAFSSNQQQPRLSQRQQLQTEKQEEQLEADSQRDPQQLWHEQRLRQEKALFALWSEGTLQPEDTQKQNVSCSDVQVPPLGTNKREERVEGCPLQDRGSPAPGAARSEREVTQLTSVGAGIATQADAKAQEEELSFVPLSMPCDSPAVADPDTNKPPSAAVAADFEIVVEQRESVGERMARVSAADETLIQMEDLFATLQELLNRLYNVALCAQERLDDLRYYLSPLLAQRTAAAVRTAMATAYTASGLREKEEKAATSTTPTAAPRTDLVKLGQTHSARAEMSGEPENEGEVEKKREGARGKGGEEYSANKGQRGEEDEEKQLCNACSTFSIGALSVAAEMRKTLFFQQGNEQKQQSNSVVCEISCDEHQRHVKERQKESQCDQRPELKKQQRFPQQSQQFSQLQPWFFQDFQAWQHASRQAKSLLSTLTRPVTSQKKKFLVEESREVQVDDWKRVVVLLQLYEAIVRTIEGEWRFKQEVKEELRFDISFKVFLAARATWLAKPFVSDLSALLCEAASLAEQCCTNRRQQQRARSRSANCRKQHCHSAPPTPTTSKA